MTRAPSRTVSVFRHKLVGSNSSAMSLEEIQNNKKCTKNREVQASRERERNDSKMLVFLPLYLESIFLSLCPITEQGEEEGECVSVSERKPEVLFLKFAELLLWTKPPWWFPWPATGGLRHTQDTAGQD